MDNGTIGSQPAAAVAGSSVANTVKICIRLVDPVNLPLRELVHYQGELTAYIVEAVESVDLGTVPLLSIHDVRGKDTTIRVSEGLFARLSKFSKERKASVNVLINTAVALWLETKRKGKLRWRQSDRAAGPGKRAVKP